MGGNGALKRKWRWSYLLPWNWLKCCRREYEPCQGEVPPEYRKLTTAEAEKLLADSGESVARGRNPAMITEPIGSIVKDLTIHKSNFKPTESKLFSIYLLRKKELVLKERKAQLAFSDFLTNKDFLSWTFTQETQGDYILYAGDTSRWHELAFTGVFVKNRLYRAIHKETHEVYIILTNFPYAHASRFITPSKRKAEIVGRLMERSDLSKPPSKDFNPKPANAEGQIIRF